MPIARRPISNYQCPRTFAHVPSGPKEPDVRKVDGIPSEGAAFRRRVSSVALQLSLPTYGRDKISGYHY